MFWKEGDDIEEVHEAFVPILWMLETSRGTLSRGRSYEGRHSYGTKERCAHIRTLIEPQRTASNYSVEHCQL